MVSGFWVLWCEQQALSLLTVSGIRQESTPLDIESSDSSRQRPMGCNYAGVPP